MNILDQLEEIKELVNEDKKFKYKNIVNFNCEDIKEELQAFEIVKEKRVDLLQLDYSETVDDYNDYMLKVGGGYYSLTEEEFFLLKRALENDIRRRKAHVNNAMPLKEKICLLFLGFSPRDINTQLLPCILISVPGRYIRL